MIYSVFSMIYVCAFAMVISPDAYNIFLRANLQVFILLLLAKPTVIAVVLGILLALPTKTIVASYAPDLCDFSHLTALPYGERCLYQQFLATAPQPKKDAEKMPADAASPPGTCSQLADGIPEEQGGEEEPSLAHHATILNDGSEKEKKSVATKTPDVENAQVINPCGGYTCCAASSD